MMFPYRNPLLKKSHKLYSNQRIHTRLACNGFANGILVKMMKMMVILSKKKERKWDQVTVFVILHALLYIRVVLSDQKMAAQNFLFAILALLFDIV